MAGLRYPRASCWIFRRKEFLELLSSPRRVFRLSSLISGGRSRAGRVFPEASSKRGFCALLISLLVNTYPRCPAVGVGRGNGKEPKTCRRARVTRVREQMEVTKTRRNREIETSSRNSSSHNEHLCRTRVEQLIVVMCWTVRRKRLR